MVYAWHIPPRQQKTVARYFYYRHQPTQKGPFQNYCVEMHNGRTITSEGGAQVTWSGSLNLDVSNLFSQCLFHVLFCCSPIILWVVDPPIHRLADPPIR